MMQDPHPDVPGPHRLPALKELVRQGEPLAMEPFLKASVYKYLKDQGYPEHDCIAMALEAPEWAEIEVVQGAAA